MSNQQLIRNAHVWVLTAIIASGLWAIAGKAGIRHSGQDPNQNQNQNGNSNTGNSNQNQNANTANRNDNTRARGEQAGMGTLSSQDQKFLMDAAISGMKEVQAGRMAAQLGSSDAVKQFGRTMVEHHTKANTELMSLAQSKGVTLPTAMEDKHRSDMSKLQAQRGADFDRAFAKMMLKDHEKAVDLFEKESTKGGDADLKAFASSTLPTLQEHLSMARALPGNEKSNSNDNSNSNSNSGSKNANSNSNSNRP
jgi:putative membrane protein